MTTILLKNKNTSAVPLAGDLTNAAGGAELALNTADKRMYAKNGGGTVIEMGTNPTELTVDNLYFNGNTIISTDTNGNINLTPNGTGSVVISKLQVTGGIQFDGNITIGNASSDTLTINSTITSNLIFTDNTYDIGASGATRPRTGYFGTSVITPLLDTTTLEVTNIRALDGTASASIANSTGVFTHATATVFTAGTVSAPAITTSGDTNTGIFFPAADTIAFAEGGAEAMRITSAGIVDIGGTSGGSVGELLVVEGANSAGHRSARINNTSTTNGYSTLWLGSSNDGILRGGSTAAAFTDQLTLLTSGANPITIYTNNTERMRIDSSGKIGINGSPQTGVSAQVEVLQVLGTDGATSTAAVKRYSADTASPNLRTYKSRASSIGTDTIVQSGDGVGAWTGYGYDGSAYINAALIRMDVDGTPGANDMPGRITFSTTADGASALTERMRIDSSGNVGINVTSPVTRLDVNGIVTIRNNGGTFNTTPNTNYGLNFQATNSGDTYITSYSSGGSTALAFATNSGGGAAVERLRIDSTGNALFAQAVRATITTDNDLSFDMNAASNFKCTPTGGGALTFTNITSGQTGNIILVNNSNYAITAAATTKVSSTCLATISATGTYWLSYYSDGTNVYVANTGALA